MGGSDGAGNRCVGLDQVSHWFPGTDLLFSRLDATLQTGTITGLCGPSGCGKSTLLKLIAGWERPRRGAVARPGVTTVAWVFQNPHGVARRPAVDHVAFPLLAQGMGRRRADAVARGLMGRFELQPVADRLFSDLSGGEAQRLLLARALACDPDLLLVDEPTAQLDRRSSAAVNRSLRQLASQGAIVVVATHDVETQAVCDSIIDLAAAARRELPATVGTAAPGGRASLAPAARRSPLGASAGLAVTRGVWP
ncbi:MAG: energy-coupling factor ABC transporter ATP-binding protein [Propionibacteriaceae bacterium]|nr:energy-coupling factor ABC transporter ATP-binding protein [Propionibacteriaceae bacterium]